MKKQEFLDNLKWIDGRPPADIINGITLEKYLADKLPPMVVKTKNDILFIGDCSSLFGSCDCCSIIDREDILSYAYLYEED
jgi:hypothetical protein